MPNPANNPLFKHFRQPAIYVKLPSKGKFYKDADIDLPVTGELPIYPMTVKDEITMRTPDALMSGAGVVDVIKSCCPNIKDPWNMPVTDVDAVFIAIRLASYGATMEITTDCPYCKEKNNHDVDLRAVIDLIKSGNYEQSIDLNGLRFKFKPQKFSELNQANLITYEEKRLIDTVLSSNLSEEEKKQKFQISFEKITNMNIAAIAASIASIDVDDETVKDLILIEEFLKNCDRKLYDLIKKEIDRLIEASKIEPINLVCDNCNKEYKNTLTFDQSNFFG